MRHKHTYKAHTNSLTTALPISQNPTARLPNPLTPFPLPSPPAARPPPDWRFISRRQTSGVPPTLQAISVDKVIIEMLWPGASDIAR